MGVDGAPVQVRWIAATSSGTERAQAPSHFPKATSGSTVTTLTGWKLDEQPSSSTCKTLQAQTAPCTSVPDAQRTKPYQCAPATVSMMPCRVPAAAAISSSFLLTTKL